MVISSQILHFQMQSSSLRSCWLIRSSVSQTSNVVIWMRCDSSYKLLPGGQRRRFNVEITFLQRQNVMLTSKQRLKDVVCLLGCVQISAMGRPIPKRGRAYLLNSILYLCFYYSITFGRMHQRIWTVDHSRHTFCAGQLKMRSSIWTNVPLQIFP